MSEKEKREKVEKIEIKLIEFIEEPLIEPIEEPSSLESKQMADEIIKSIQRKRKIGL